MVLVVVARSFVVILPSHHIVIAERSTQTSLQSCRRHRSTPFIAVHPALADAFRGAAAYVGGAGGGDVSCRAA